MSKKSILSLGAAAILLVVGIMAFGGDKGQSSPALSVIPTVHAQSHDFLYEDFSQERYDALRGSEAFAVFFHSRSCGTCAKKHQQIIGEVNQFSGGTILKLEFDEADADLLRELGVIKYDTFVVFDASGNPITIPGAGIDDVRNAIGVTEIEADQETN